LAQRVAKEGRKHLSFPIQGSWFTVGDTWEAGHALRTAATHLKIPALTTKQYLSICRTPQQIKNAAIDSFLR
jgi:hypothetical protein